MLLTDMQVFVHSNFGGGAFFGSAGVCSKIVGLLALSLIFLPQATFIEVARASVLHSNFEGVERFKNHFCLNWFQLKGCCLSCHITDFFCAVNNFHRSTASVFHCCLRCYLKLFLYKIIFFLARFVSAQGL